MQRLCITIACALWLARYSLRNVCALTFGIGKYMIYAIAGWDPAGRLARNFRV